LAPAIKEIPLHSWEELVGRFDDLPAWIFRGHASTKWDLQSTLDRMAPAGHPKTFAEYSLTREFKRRAHTYLQAHQVPTKPGEWLALMQHFGAPTRLLDFTKSPYVAAYFAFEDLPLDGSDRCAIWAIEPGWCFTEFAYKVGSQGDTLFGLNADEINDALDRAKGWASEKRSDGEPRTDAEIRGRQLVMVGSILAQMIDDKAEEAAPLGALVFEPERLSERMSAQQGVFIWPGDVNATVMDNVLALGHIERGVRKFTVPTSERGRALEQLRLMNITRTSLFPGLEGFAQSFRQALIRDSTEGMERRALLRALGNQTTEDS
jgi:hypothetical protein